jgi:hypothetical protein
MGLGRFGNGGENASEECVCRWLIGATSYAWTKSFTSINSYLTRRLSSCHDDVDLNDRVYVDYHSDHTLWIPFPNHSMIHSNLIDKGVVDGVVRDV